MADRIRPVMHSMQPSGIDSILYGPFSQAHLFKLLKGQNPMLCPGNHGDPLIGAPTGRFPRTGVGFRPVDGLFGGVSLQHRRSLAGEVARVTHTERQLRHLIDPEHGS
jgi:hypothetical protein